MRERLTAGDEERKERKGKESRVFLWGSFRLPTTDYRYREVCISYLLLRSELASYSTHQQDKQTRIKHFDILKIQKS